MTSNGYNNANGNGLANGIMPEGYLSPDTPPKCTWSKRKAEGKESPHYHKPSNPPDIRDTILDSVLDAIGNTPMIRMDRIAKSVGLECDLVAKCEFMSAGGSLKDRVGLRMIEDAERQGILKEGDTIIEPTSGNTGIALAVVANVKKYKSVFVMPEKMSDEKVSILKVLGADVVRTPTKASIHDPDSNYAVVYKLKNNNPKAHILDQYHSASNPLAHYDGTAEEIIKQCGGKVDMVVVGAGTGGCVAGIGKKLKEKLKDVKIVAVDADSSIMARPAELNKGGGPYKVEGIGHDFIPTVLDYAAVDEWCKVTDEESFYFARKLIREEGLLVGGSCGSVVAAAVKSAKSLKAGQRCVVLLPDSIRNYITKFADDNWMLKYGFMEPEVPKDHMRWWNLPVENMKFNELIKVEPSTTCREAINVLKTARIQELPVVTSTGEIEGVVTLSYLTTKVLEGSLKQSDSISSAIIRQFETVDVKDTLGKLSCILKVDKYALVTETVNGKKRLVCVITSLDFLDFIANP